VRPVRAAEQLGERLAVVDDPPGQRQLALVVDDGECEAEELDPA
jgi:hypothetical protein